LALPNGSIWARDLPAAEMETNRLATTQVNGAPKLVRYTIGYGEGGGFDGPPDDADLLLTGLTAAEQDVIRQIASELGLPSLQPEAAIRRASEFFLENFSYTLYQPDRSRSRTNASPLSAFLLEHREGHCEFFATATVLLLRQAGVPARYAVGYSIQERSGARYVVRERHAHAWCLAYLDGRWRDIDTTPANWHERESSQAPFWEPARDLFSNAWFAFNAWRQSDSSWRAYLFIGALAVLAFMAYRQLAGSRWRRARRSAKPGDRWLGRRGVDSEFYEIERRLGTRLAPRAPAESLFAWAHRLRLSPDGLAARLEKIIRLHYRYRFDPNGLSEADRAALRSAVADWIARYRQARPR
jgi:hypothetical protein